MILAAIVIALFYGRLVYHKVPASPLVPTMWIVVGPLGQSIAGMIALGAAARSVCWGRPRGRGPCLRRSGLGIRDVLARDGPRRDAAALKHLPFTLGWWAFTFPLGVLISGTNALFTVTPAPMFAASSALLLLLLATTWSVVAVRTLHGASRAAGTSLRTHAFGEAA